MFGFGKTYNSINYIQKRTGFRCSQLNRLEFDEMKYSGFQSNAELDPLGVPTKATAYSMIGEINYLFNLYEQREDQEAMLHIRDAIYFFMDEYQKEIPDYVEILFSIPTNLRR
jgi:hypothetical protein